MTDQSRIFAGGIADDQVTLEIRRNGEFLEAYLKPSPQHAPILLLTVLEEGVAFNRANADDFRVFVNKVPQRFSEEGTKLCPFRT
jgi:hypothetical protein